MHIPTSDRTQNNEIKQIALGLLNIVFEKKVDFENFIKQDVTKANKWTVLELFRQIIRGCRVIQNDNEVVKKALLIYGQINESMAHHQMKENLFCHFFDEEKEKMDRDEEILNQGIQNSCDETLGKCGVKLSQAEMK